MTTWLKKARMHLRLFFKSIRFRLTLWSTAILVVILLVFSIFVYYRQAQYLLVDTRVQLLDQAQRLAPLYHLADQAGTGPASSQLPDLTMLNSGMLSGSEALAVIGANGSTIQKLGGISDNLIHQLMQTWQTSGQFPGAVTYISSSGGLPGLHLGNQTLYLVSPITDDRRQIGLIILSSPIDPRGQLHTLLVTLVLASLGTLAIAMLGGYWLAARAMSPVHTITRTARSISETDLHRRLNLGTQDELGELADTFDAMLDRLQAAFDRQRQFTANASHELRTPLTIVSLEADQVLSRRRSVGEYERALAVIKSENKFMSHLVNDLLTLARMDAGQTQMKFEPLDLSDLALDVIDRLNSLASRAGVELHVGDFPAVSVRGDLQYLTQLITNLVENAIKYAGGRGHHVRVETGQRAIAGQPFGWLQVEDDGPGIPAEHLPYLFDRFYRVDQARAASPPDDLSESNQEKELGGSGLGLSISQWIARAHGGQVVVYSEVGKGSTFELQLPCLAPRPSLVPLGKG
jgi:signal transduction histidine kinase